MPYIEVDELEEGQTAADVYTADDYNALNDQLTSMTTERDELKQSIDALNAEKDKLTADLVSAKTKFADAFLSTKQAPQADPVKPERQPATFDSLFGEDD